MRTGSTQERFALRPAGALTASVKSYADATHYMLVLNGFMLVFDGMALVLEK